MAAPEVQLEPAIEAAQGAAARFAAAVAEQWPAIVTDDTPNLIKIVVVAPILYFAVILFIRVAGKRITSQMNNFDWIVTVAMGSLVASGLLMRDVSLVEALAAIGALIVLQYLATLLAAYIPPVEALIKAEPRLLLHRGEYLPRAMRRERVTKAEVLAALRENGLTRLEDAEWVILESDASLSVVPRSAAEGGGPRTAFANVSRVPDATPADSPPGSGG